MAGDLFGELKRRKVFKVGAAYLVVAWLAVQAASIGFPAFDAPPWALRVFILVSLLGFPIALVMAWVFESTPEGMHVDPVRAGTKRVVGVAAVLVALALAWYFKGQPSYRAGEPVAAGAATPAVAAGAGEAAAGKPLPAISPQSIAVLPFENLSDAKGNEYFVSGMQDMILTSLYKLQDLKVISRTSTQKYASRPENVREIARELGVAFILEGSVQREGAQVRINLQLIDARDDTHVWAEVFDRKVEDVFTVEKEVAGLVADALRTTLLPAARAELGAAPTANAAAYDLYLRAEYEYAQYGMHPNAAAVLRQSVAHFQDAVAADPAFALAYARLSSAQALLYWDGDLGNDTRAALATRILENAQRAKQLAPDLPEADLALAEYQYRVKLDYPGALASYDAVLARQPRNVTALLFRSFTLRRLGRYEEAIAAQSAAIELDPRDSFPVNERGLTRFFAGHLDAAEADYRRAASLNPADEQALGRLGQLRVFRGDLDGALQAARGDGRRNPDIQAFVLSMQHRYADALAVIDQARADGRLDATAMELRASVLARMGRTQEARAALAPRIAQLRADVAALPQNSGAGQAARFSLARAEAILGHTDAALALVAQALAQLPVKRDPANGSRTLGYAAAVYASLGRADLALPLLAQVRALPGTDLQTSAATLRMDADFDPIRDDPRFQREIALFEAKQASSWH